MSQHPQFFTGAPAPRPAQPRVIPAPAAPVPVPVASPVRPVEHVVQEEVSTTPAGIAPYTGTLDALLRWLVDHHGSDLHLSGDEVPFARINGELNPLAVGPTPSGRLEQMIAGILNERQGKQFADTNDVDLAYELDAHTRFRVNVMRNRGKVAAVMRTIPTKVKTVEDLELSPALCALAALPRGLVLVVGQTGSGKSTTLAALVNLANRTRRGHIITIEDPVEFPHNSILSKVTQREVGEDTATFDSGLRAAMRQDPDIILVGELRDQETTRIALEAAETGHLVFATMHTKSASETIDRFVSQFPDGIQNQIRMALSSALEAVVVQTLVKTVDGNGRVAAREILLLDPASRSLIRQHKLAQITNVLQSGGGRGMTTLDADLARLVAAGQTTREAAEAVALDPDELAERLNSMRRS